MLYFLALCLGGGMKGFSEKKVRVGVEEAQPEADAKR